ncbi:hypothetical protein DIPPA_27541 [Diplonema papillatum]|nr:hypothetical protein DIPPA_27541 [Diplonema papillatum]
MSVPKSWPVETGRPHKVLHLPTRVLTTADIAGATAVKRIPEVVRRRNDFHLNCNDIPHTSPESKAFHTARTGDPLVPTYTLPSFKYRPHTPTKQLATTNYTEDIDGARSQPLFRWPIRDTMSASCTVLCSTLASTRSKRMAPGLSLTTRDINHPEGLPGFKTSRVTDPLSPKYRVSAAPCSDSILSLHGQNHPRRLPKGKDASFASLSLKTTDIVGTAPLPNVPFPPVRRHWRKTCDISDIGFTAPSTKHSSKNNSARATNPTNPSYLSLEHKAIRLGD